jgi:alpha-glucosidase
MIDLYQSLLEDAAKNHILLDFHGANKPTGEARTWPNELNREAIKGMEASKLADRATHDVTLPFTRFLAGHADYTPVHFGDRRGNTTAAHQIATAVVFTAPLLTYAANPHKLLEQPAVEIIKSIPATWDETQVLAPSEIGQVALFARRSTNTWFLAVLNGPATRSIQVPLSFLGKGRWQGLVVRDDETRADQVRLEEKSFHKGDFLRIQLSSGGGFIARLRQQ